MHQDRIALSIALGCVTSLLCLQQHSWAGSSAQPTITPERCASTEYVTRAEAKKIDRDDITAICGSGALPGSKNFDDAWRQAMRECELGKQLSIMLVLRDSPSSSYGPDWLIDCAKVYKIVEKYKVATAKQIAESQERLASEKRRSTAFVDRLRNDSREGNLEAAYLLAINLYDIENIKTSLDIEKLTEAADNVDRFANPKSTFGSNRAFRFYQYLSEMEKKYPDRMTYAHEAILFGHGALSRNNYAPSSLRLGKYYADRAMRAYSRGDYAEGRSARSEGEKYFDSARKFGGAEVARKVDEFERLMDDAENKEVTAAEVGGFFIALLALAASQQPAAASNDDAYALERNRQQAEREECQRTVDLYDSLYSAEEMGAARAFASCP